MFGRSVGIRRREKENHEAVVSICAVGNYLMFQSRRYAKTMVRLFQSFSSSMLLKRGYSSLIQLKMNLTRLEASHDEAFLFASDYYKGSGKVQCRLFSLKSMNRLLLSLLLRGGSWSLIPAQSSQSRDVTVHTKRKSIGLCVIYQHPFSFGNLLQSGRNVRRTFESIT